MKARVLLALGLLGCGEETVCDAAEQLDSFTVVITDDAWLAEEYRITVSYQDDGTPAAFQCDVRVPAYRFDVQLDGGIPILRGVDPRSGPSCMRTQGAADMNAEPVTLSVGRALEARFPGTPAKATLAIDTPRGRVLERELLLSYATPADGCGGPTTAAVRVELP